MSRYQTDNVAKNSLTDMGINFVSLCGRGIHSGATVSIFKSADMPPDNDEVDDDNPFEDDEDLEIRGHLAKYNRNHGSDGRFAGGTGPGSPASEKLLASRSKTVRTADPDLMRIKHQFQETQERKAKDEKRKGRIKRALEAIGPAMTSFNMSKGEGLEARRERTKQAQAALDRRAALAQSKTDDDEDDDAPTSVEGVKRKLRSMKEEKSTDVDKAERTVSSTDHPPTGVNMPDIELPDDLPDEVRDYVGKLEEAVLTLTAQADSDTVDKAVDDEDDLASLLKTSDLDDVAKAVLLKAVERVDAAEKRAEAAEALAKAQSTAAVRKAVKTKADSYVGLGKSADEVASTLFDLRVKDPEIAKAVEELLDSASTAVANSTFQDMGKAGFTATGSKADDFAKGYREADPSMSEEAALAKAYEEHPELYDEYLSEKGA